MQARVGANFGDAAFDDAWAGDDAVTGNGGSGVNVGVVACHLDELTEFVVDVGEGGRVGGVGDLVVVDGGIERLAGGVGVPFAGALAEGVVAVADLSAISADVVGELAGGVVICNMRALGML